MNNMTETYATIDQLELDGVMEKLLKKEKMSQARAEKAIELYRNFLKLAKSNPENILVPNEDVDAAWHHHILDTVKYMRDCQELFGTYLHHNPNFYGTDAFFESVKITNTLYAKSFDGTEDFLSSLPAACGGMRQETDGKAAACGGMMHEQTVDTKPAICSGMRHEGALNAKAAACGGMLHEPTVNAKSAACGGMMHNGALNAKAAACGGMLHEPTLDTKAAACGGMLHEPTVNAKPAACGGMLREPFAA